MFYIIKAAPSIEVIVRAADRKAELSGHASMDCYMAAESPHLVLQALQRDRVLTISTAWSYYSYSSDKPS